MAKEEKIASDAKVDGSVEAGNTAATDAENETVLDADGKMPSHYKRPTIFYSRIWTICAAAIIIFSPIIIAVYYNAGPNWAAVIGGLVAVVPIYWPASFIELFTYIPLLGPSSTMLSLVTGNLTNMKIPAALTALEEFKAKSGTEKAKVICLMACSTCALTGIIICCISVAGLSALKPVLDNPVLSPAFSCLLPALFGSLGFTFFIKDWKLAIFPTVFFTFLFVCFPSLSKFAGLLVPVGVVLSIINARILFKAGILDDKDSKEKKKSDKWEKFKAWCVRNKKQIRIIGIPAASLCVIGIVLAVCINQYPASFFKMHQNAVPENIGERMNEIWFDETQDFDYQAAYDYFNNLYHESRDVNPNLTPNITKEDLTARCTSLTNDGIYGHNYDWLKDSVDEYVVHVQGNADRYASVGISSNITSTYKVVSNIESESATQEELNSLPYSIVDGMNEKGVYCAVNKVSEYNKSVSDQGLIQETHPDAQDIPSLLVTRIILDKCGSAEEAIYYLRRLNIISYQEKLQFMIGDEKRFYVIEVEDGKCTVLVDNVMTNFNLNSTTDELYSTGIERYNLATESILDVNNTEDMITLLKQVRYSRIFSKTTDPVWYSDLYDLAIDIGIIEQDNGMTKEEIIGLLDDFRTNPLFYDEQNYYQAGFCSIHSVVYDTKAKRMHLLTEEGNTVSTFSLSHMTQSGDDVIDLNSSVAS